MDYSRFFSSSSKARKPSYIRYLYDHVIPLCKPDTISLGPGLPSPDVHSLKEAVFTLSDGTVVELDETLLKEAQMYGSSSGFKPFREWCEEFIKRTHAPPTAGAQHTKNGMGVVVTNGAQDGFTKAFHILLNPGDHILVDEITYPAALAEIRAIGAVPVVVPSDERGMSPWGLENILVQWWDNNDAADHKTKGNFPKVLYIIPTGFGPSGIILSLQRKKELYLLAQKYDLIMIEDDPYFFLQYTNDPSPSFLSIDTDGRVLRCDSFSKLLGGGFRVGILSGPHPLLSKINILIGLSSMHTSHLSQVVLLQLFRHWGPNGLQKHIQKVRLFYQVQRNTLHAAAEKWLAGLCEWKVPEAGIFMWFRLTPLSDARVLIENQARDQGVILIPGCTFIADPEEPNSYIRACFSYATALDMDQAMERLANAIRLVDSTQQNL